MLRSQCQKCQLSANAAAAASRRVVQQLQRRLLATERRVVALSSTVPDTASAQPVWPAVLAQRAQQLAATAAGPTLATVTGHTTPNVADVGGASLRLRFADPLGEGGYLLCIRPVGQGWWLPAIAGVPGDRGPDDHASSQAIAANPPLLVIFESLLTDACELVSIATN